MFQIYYTSTLSGTKMILENARDEAEAKSLVAYWTLQYPHFDFHYERI